jgi:hypothetical protein
VFSSDNGGPIYFGGSSGANNWCVKRSLSIPYSSLHRKLVNDLPRQTGQTDHRYREEEVDETDRGRFSRRRPQAVTRRKSVELARRYSCECLGVENGIFFEFSLCLSRACLGKMMHFI